MSATTFTVNAMPSAAACRGAAASSSSACRAASLRPVNPTAATLKLRASKRTARHAMMIRAADGEAAEAAAPAAPAAAPMDPAPGSFSKICALEDLPRGDRKKVSALGKSILLFWYKARSLTIFFFFLFFPPSQIVIESEISLFFFPPFP